MKWLFLVLILSLLSCDEEEKCDVMYEVKCSGEELRICNADKNWETFMNCSDEGLICCLMEYGYDCAEKCEWVEGGGADNEQNQGGAEERELDLELE